MPSFLKSPANLHNQIAFTKFGKRLQYPRNDVNDAVSPDKGTATSITPVDGVVLAQLFSIRRAGEKWRKSSHVMLRTTKIQIVR